MELSDYAVLLLVSFILGVAVYCIHLVISMFEKNQSEQFEYFKKVLEQIMCSSNETLRISNENLKAFIDVQKTEIEAMSKNPPLNMDDLMRSEMKFQTEEEEKKKKKLMEDILNELNPKENPT